MNVERKQWAVCFDSDGCVMDSMTSKHQKCFGPCLVEEWALWDRQEEALKCWNTINLYSASRGINRFVGLVQALETLLPGKQEELVKLRTWTLTTPELSNGSLEQAVRESGLPILKKALSWSRAVNREIAALPPEGPFPHAPEGVKSSAGWADVAVVSSANRAAVEAEWTAAGLLEYVGGMMTQEQGNKEACIRQLIARGYAPDHVLMVGDSAGDLEAALGNGTLFYPILAGREAASWKAFSKEILPRFRDGTYKGAAMEFWIANLQNNWEGE